MFRFPYFMGIPAPEKPHSAHFLLWRCRLQAVRIRSGSLGHEEG